MTVKKTFTEAENTALELIQGAAGDEAFHTGPHANTGGCGALPLEGR